MGFFTVIVLKQKTASDTKLSGKITKQLNTILTGAGVSPGTSQVIPIPKVEIRFTCDDYYIGPASQRLGNKVVFATNNLKGNKLVTWALDWNMPFKIMNFLYISAPTIRYVFVYDNPANKNYAEKYYAKFPIKFTKEIMDMNKYVAFVSKRDEQIRFLFFTSSVPTTIPIGLKNEIVSGLFVDPKNSQVTYLTHLGKTYQSSLSKLKYSSAEALFGAIIADNEDNYKCLMLKAFKRLNVVANIYSKKFNSLAGDFKGTSCEGFYKNNQYFSDLKSYTSDVSFTDIDQLKIANVGKDLEIENTKLQLNSCPLYY